MDAIPKKDLLPLIAHWSALHPFADVIPISARKKENLELLLEKVVGVLKEGQRYFPKHQLTDQPERFPRRRTDPRKNPAADWRRSPLRDRG